jgi:hypothetical protein
MSQSLLKVGLSRGKQRHKCRDCGYKFVENAIQPPFCGLYTGARKNHIRISRSLADGLEIKEGDGIGFSFDEGTMFVFKEAEGFEIQLKASHLQVYDNALYKYICRFFDLDHHLGYRFEGEVSNNLWEMKKITKKNIHEVIGYTDYRRKLPPTATIMSNRMLLFSKAAIDLLVIDKADKLELAEDGGKIFIGVNPDGEFKISMTDHGATTVSSKKIGDYFIKKFDLSDSDLPFRMSILEKGSLESDGVTYFQVTKEQQVNE